MKRLPVFLCALALLLSLCLPAAAAPRYPAMNGMYTDAAGVLSSATLSDLRELQKKLDQEDALRLHIVTVDFLDGQDADPGEEHQVADQRARCRVAGRDDAHQAQQDGEGEQARGQPQ